MTGVHPDLGPELRQLAQSLLDRIDPTLRMGLAVLLDGAEGSGKCEQVWCPVCALAAFVNDEQHPMLTLIGEHSVTLLDTVRSLIDGGSAPPPPPPTDPSGPRTQGTAGEPGRYQPIAVTVEE